MRGWWILGAVAVVAAGAAAIFFASRQAPCPPIPIAADVSPWKDNLKTTLEGNQLRALSDGQRCALGDWMRANNGFAVISRDFCDCAQGLAAGQSPYVVVHDLNGDRQDDLAILLENVARTGLSGEHGGPGMLLIFNGPFDARNHPPVVASRHVRETDGIWLVEETGRLMLGPDGSDDTVIFNPTATGYTTEYGGE